MMWAGHVVWKEERRLPKIAETVKHQSRRKRGLGLNTQEYEGIVDSLKVASSPDVAWDNRVLSQHDVAYLKDCGIACTKDNYKYEYTIDDGTYVLASDVATAGANDDSSTTPPPGHLEPFGGHRPAEGDVDSLDAFPDPKTFFEKYVKVGKPVLFRGAAKGIPAFKLWTDKYLAEKYGDIDIDVEHGKKELRADDTRVLSFRKFLDTYKDDDIYMVQNVKPSMKGDLSMLKPIMCGGFHLEVAVIWFSSGNTKSVLHTDSVENINCIFDGDKDIVFVDKKYKDEVEKVGWQVDGSFSQIDVEKVDMNKYSHLANVPWWRARMEKGDCLYIPLVWYHTVASSKTRNLASNLWFDPILRFNQSDCDGHKDPLPDYDSLAKYEFNPEPLSDELYLDNAKYLVFEAFRDMEEMPMSHLVNAWKEIMPESDAKKVFAQLDANSDGVLSWDEVNKANLFTIIMQFPHIVPGMTPEDVEGIKESLGLQKEEEGAGEEGREEADGAEGEEVRKEEL
ncbi:hypothetical protein LSAT2_027102 [Lamellibrachia satsuma]|nr:hypothetical protein LSAT2_027102 [Lamellibrachia satsuma]